MSEAKTYYSRARGIPAATYIEYAWLTGPLDTKGQREQVQWKAAAAALALAVSVSFLAGFYPSKKKCDLVQRRVQI